MAREKTFPVEVTITPMSGKPTKKIVNVIASATAREVAEAAGITDIDKKNLLVDGEPAKPDTRVNSNSRVGVAPRKMTVTERPQGS